MYLTNSTSSSPANWPALRIRPDASLQRVQAKWTPVRVKKTREYKNLEHFHISMKREKAPEIKVLIQALAICLNIAPADLMSRQVSRQPFNRHLVRLRHFAIYLSHVALGLSQRLTGRLFARDRTTVRYICARMENLRDDPRIDRMLSAIEAAVLAFTAAFFGQTRQVQS